MHKSGRRFVDNKDDGISRCHEVQLQDKQIWRQLWMGGLHYNPPLKEFVLAHSIRAHELLMESSKAVLAVHIHIAVSTHIGCLAAVRIFVAIHSKAVHTPAPLPRFLVVRRHHSIHLAPLPWRRRLQLTRASAASCSSS